MQNLKYYLYLYYKSNMAENNLVFWLLISLKFKYLISLKHGYWNSILTCRNSHNCNSAFPWTWGESHKYMHCKEVRGTAWSTLQDGPGYVVLFLRKHVLLPPDRSQLWGVSSVPAHSLALMDLPFLPYHDFKNRQSNISVLTPPDILSLTPTLYFIKIQTILKSWK